MTLHYTFSAYASGNLKPIVSFFRKFQLSANLIPQISFEIASKRSRFLKIYSAGFAEIVENGARQIIEVCHGRMCVLDVESCEKATVPITKTFRYRYGIPGHHSFKAIAWLPDFSFCKRKFKFAEI